MNAPAVVVDNPFAVAKANTQNAIAEAGAQREIAEVQASMMMAKRFPRDPVAAMDRILNAFSRPGLAEVGLYEYSKGGTAVTGPSIRAAEALAQNWGNLQFGIRELDQRDGESTVEAFAWDIETNTRQTKVFQVPHVRYTRNGSYALKDPREVYELIANNGARRLRACILGVIPGDVIEAAVRQCELTLNAKADTSAEAMAKMVEAFGAFGVTKQQLETRIQRRLDAISAAQVVTLKKIYASLRDGMSSPADWFDVAAVEGDKPAATAADKLKAAAKEVTAKATAAASKVQEAAQAVATMASGEMVNTTTGEVMTKEAADFFGEEVKQ